MVATEQEQAERDRSWRLRGLAIQDYAILEQSLSCLLAYLINANWTVAGYVFFKVTNAGARAGILERLLKLKMRRRKTDAFTTFWNSYDSALRATDQQRNKIVHWNAVLVRFDDGLLHPALVQPNIHIFQESDERITSDDIVTD